MESQRLFLIFCATFYAGRTHAVRPSEGCEALLALSRQYTGVGPGTLEYTEAALKTLRRFRFDLGFPKVDPACNELHLDSETASPKDRALLASQIQGLESFLIKDENNLGEARRLWGFGMSEDAVSKDLLRRFQAERDRVRANISSSPQIFLPKVKRFGSAVLLTMIGATHLTYIPLWTELLGGDLQAILGILLFLSSEPIALLHYPFHKDPNTKKLLGTLASFEEKISKLDRSQLRNPAQQAPWAFHSWRYQVREVTLQGLFIDRANLERDALAIQDLYDSRGLFFRLYRPYELRSGVQKRTIPPGQINMEKPIWIFFDLLQSVDVETGKELVVLTIRSSRKSDPKFSTATAPAAEELRVLLQEAEGAGSP